MSGPFRLEWGRQILEGMIAQARDELPNECCGLLAGRLLPAPAGPARGRVSRRYPLVNAAASPREYLSEPHSLLAAVKDCRARGLEILAVYHSHPTSGPAPSRTDLERNGWPGVAHVIISLAGTEPEVRAWWLTAETFSEAVWSCRDDL